MKEKLFVLLAAVVLLAPCMTAEPVKGEGYKRVIYAGVDDTGIKKLKDSGCIMWHKMKGSTSFECPSETVPGLKVRESRVFHITDLTADVQIGADKVWDAGITGSGVAVAVLDTGLDTDHPELADSYLGGYDYVNNDPYPEDDHGHGTHVAGIITSNGVSNGNSKGVSPGAGIYMYKVCNSGGSCYEDDMMAAMEAAVGTGAKVMSISIGGGSYTTENCDSDTLAAKVNWVASQGMTVVVAAGNDGRGVSTPGCASKAIAVGAVDKSNSVPYFSGRGPALDIVAPGVSIYSTLINGYGTMSGTSMATPHVSGVVALLLEKNSALTTDQIKNALYTTANPVNLCYKCTRWVGSTCRSQTTVTCTPAITGAGVVDAYKAYLAVQPQVKCTSDGDCADSLICNGAEKCVDGVCQKGTPPDCGYLADPCNTGACIEPAGCTKQPKADGTACDDGLFCSVSDVCAAGSCTGGTRSCSDGNACTADSCNEDSDSCDNPWPSCGIGDGCCGPSCSSASDADCASKCWSADNAYLLRDTAQARKFCKCATGTYGYKTYSYSRGTKTVYKYTDTGDNTNWATASTSSYYPVYRVRCSDGIWYNTNQDYAPK